MVSKYKIFLAAIVLVASTYAQANGEWIARIIKEGDPLKLVALLLYLKEHPEQAPFDKAQEQLHAYLEANSSELSQIEFPVSMSVVRLPTRRPVIAPRRLDCVFPVDLVRHILRFIAKPTLRDVACLRRTCTHIRAIVDRDMAGRIQYVVDSPQTLALLMMLEGPMLHKIGSLVFDLGSARITPFEPRFYKKPATRMGDYCGARMSVMDEDFPLFATLRMYWQQFLDANTEGFRNLHSLHIEESPVPIPGENREFQSHLDFFVIAPLLYPFDRFPRLTCLKVLRSWKEKWNNLRMPSLQVLPDFSLAHQLRELYLKHTFLDDSFFDRVEAGDFDNLRVLHLITFEESRTGQLERALQNGRLAHVEETLLDIYQNYPGPGPSIARAMPQLKRLILGHPQEVPDLAAQEPGAFRNLREVDVAGYILNEYNSEQNFIFSHFLPALESIRFSLFRFRNVLPLWLRDPENARVIEIVDDATHLDDLEWEQVCAPFISLVARVPQQVLRIRPGLTRLLARYLDLQEQRRSVVEWKEVEDPSSDEEEGSGVTPPGARSNFVESLAL